MFTVSKILKKPQKFTFDQHDINESIIKYNKLMLETHKKNTLKKSIENILHGNELIKPTKHSVNDLINNTKYRNFIFIVSFVSFVSFGALIFYKSK